MKFWGILIFLAFVTVVASAQKYKCLPPDVKDDSVVSATTSTSPQGVPSIKQVTVAQTLKKLKARCSRGNLVDGKRRPITFFKLQGCWGNPPADSMEILARQKAELAKLKKKYTVIEMTCNPGGMLPQSIA